MKKKRIRVPVTNRVLSKLWKIMRLSVFFLFLFVSQTFATATYSQQTRLTLKMQNIKVIDVLSKIEDESEFFFLFNQKLVDVDRQISIDVKNESIDKILTRLFGSSNVSYLVKDRQIVLTTANPELGEAVQQKVVSGKVTDSSGGSLPGVSIVVVGTTTGTVTDFDGNYTLANVSENATLQFSFMGMKSQDVVVGGKTSINITMVEDAIGLDEVVAIGYGTVKKSDLTGAVASVKAEELQKATASSVGQALSGRIPGLQVMNTSANPGGEVSFLIRGAASNVNNDPLIVLDGFPLTDTEEPGSGNQYGSAGKSALNSISPDDIESIEVLKDASSTAIYGARAANGVILITTKRGKIGFKVTYDGNYSVQKVADSWDVPNATEYLTLRNRFYTEEAKLNQNIMPYGSNPLSDLVLPSNLHSQAEINSAGRGTRWLDEVFRTGTIKKHNLSLSGGTDKTKYLVSLNKYENKGIVKSNGFRKVSGRVNLDQKIGKYIDAGITATFTRENHDNVPVGPGVNENAGVIRTAIEFNPTIPVKNPDGSYPINPLRTYIANPVSLLEIDDETQSDRIMAMAYLEVKPLTGLKIRVNMGTDIYNSIRDTYLPKTTLNGALENGKASRALKRKSDYLFDATATYNKLFVEKHNVSLMGGYSYQEFNWDGFSASNNDFLIDEFLWYDLSGGQAEKPFVDSEGGKDLIASYFGRVNYIYDSKYLFTATFRADGASNFAANKKWGYFPSLALGWIITKEKFMEPVNGTISHMKVRATYGQTGNNSIAHKALAAYRTGRSYFFNNKRATGVYTSQLDNPDLTWETSTEFNLGLDFGLFAQRLRGNVDVYRRIVSDLLFDKPLLSYHEVDEIAFNVGKTQSKGIEINLNADLVKTSKFSWEANYNFSMYRDTWKERDASWKPSIYNKKDEPLRPIYSTLSDGLVQPGENIPHMQGAIPGTIKIKDINGFKRNTNGTPVVDENGRFQYLGAPDGILDDADVVLLGTRDPGYMMSLNNTFKYKNFDLNVYFYGYFDRSKVDATRAYYEAGSYVIREGANVYKTVLDAWSSDNMNSQVPSFFQGLSSWGSGDYYNQKAWFIRLHHITLGYTLPSHLLSSIGVKSTRVYCDAQNLFVITPYKGIDPETDSDRGGSLDNRAAAAYPNQRTFTLGLSVSF